MYHFPSHANQHSGKHKNFSIPFTRSLFIYLYFLEEDHT